MAPDTISDLHGSVWRCRVSTVCAVLFGCLLWSYWPIIVELRACWARNDDYSVGQLVPFVALYLAWRKRRNLEFSAVRTCWWGLVLILAAEVGRLFGVYFYYASAERYSLVLAIVGVALLVMGWPAFQRFIGVFAFLLLMVPFPKRIHEMISLPLQRMASASAAFALETLGFVVARKGNVLQLDDRAVVAVTEACSGLRMLTAFIFVAAVLAFIIRRPAWQKVMILASSIPIAIFANALRLVATSLFIVLTKSLAAEEMFHDYAGLAMMPLGVLMLLAELWLMSNLTSVRTACREVPAEAKAG